MTLMGVTMFGMRKIFLSYGSPVLVHVSWPNAVRVVTILIFDWMQKPSLVVQGKFESKAKQGTLERICLSSKVVLVLKECTLSAYSPASSTQKHWLSRAELTATPRYNIVKSLEGLIK